MYVCVWQCLMALWSLPAGKPLIVSEFGMWRPMSVRNEVFQALYEELLSAKNSGLPVAGAGLPVWQLTCLRTSNSEARPCMQSYLVLKAGAGVLLCTYLLRDL